MELDKKLAKAKCEETISKNGMCTIGIYGCNHCPGNAKNNNDVGCTKNGWAGTESDLNNKDYYANVLISAKKWMNENFPIDNIYVEED